MEFDKSRWSCYGTVTKTVQVWESRGCWGGGAILLQDLGVWESIDVRGIDGVWGVQEWGLGGVGVQIV